MSKLIYIENLILRILAIISPWLIFLASPQFHIGYWGQVEGMILATYLLSAIISLLLLRVGYNNRKIRSCLGHPLIIIPIFIGFYSIISSFFQRLPILALFGSPQIGQGAFWYFSLAIFTILYLVLNTNKNWVYGLFLNLFLVVLIITIGSFYPSITGIVISFFGFNDWLALYFVSFIILFFILTNDNNFLKYKKLLQFFSFLCLGPLFWIIDNNSAIALWLLIFLAWLIYYVMNNLNLKFKKFIYNPLFFTLIPVFLSIIMVATSFIFWDGETDQTNNITNTDSWIGHLGTLVARGSIVRVMFEHLINLKVIILGYGWGSISELLISSFTPEVFYQINTGNRVHFHTHNELFEHIFSIGFVGAFLYLVYTYFIFKFSYRSSNKLALMWLLYFCISAFWFQWVSNIVIQALLVGLIFKLDHEDKELVIFNKIKKFANSKLIYSLCMISISIFLFYGSYISYFTSHNHMNNFRASQLINLAENYERGGSCTVGVNDFGKGALQFSQKFNGFNNYYKDQVLLYGKLNESDYLVLNWYLCASDYLIKEGKASLELINVHINVLSMISILPGELGVITRSRVEEYLNTWENKLFLLLNIAPKRVDQSTSLISYFLNNNNYLGVKRICNKIEKIGHYQGYCDLSLGAIFLEEGNFDKGIELIRKASQNGVLDSEYIDKETADSLKKMLENIK